MKAPQFKLLILALIATAMVVNLSCDKKSNPVEPDNTRPEVAITGLAAGLSYLVGDTITFTATATDTEDGALEGSSLVWISNRDGQFGTGSPCQIDTLSVNTHLIILTATDSDGAIGADTTTIIVLSNDFPEVSIEAPADGLVMSVGDTTMFLGSGSDLEDGTLADADLVWTSDLDGQIGVGDTLVTTSLSLGNHVITLAATDSDINSASASIAIDVRYTFEKTYGGYLWDDARSVCATPDGGFVMAGGTLNGIYGNYDIYILKVDSLGNLVWETKFGREDFDWGISISQATGGYIVTGYTGIESGTLGRDLYLAKIDENGNADWQTNFGRTNQDIGNCAIETSDGGFLVAGQSCRDNYVADIYLVKTDFNGEAEWEKTYGVEEENEVANSVCQTLDGGFVIAGYKHGAGGYNDLYLFKTDDTGAVVWEGSFGSTWNEAAGSVRELSDGGFIMTGYAEPVDAFVKDVWLIRTDNTGDMIWDQTFGGYNNDEGYDVRETSDGGFIISGYTTPEGAVHKDAYLIKTNSSGVLQWERTFGGEVREWGSAVLQTNDGGYLVAGLSDSWGYGGYYDVYLIKTNSLGYVY